MIYLASVYSQRPEGITDEQHGELMEKRYEYVEKKAAEFIRGGMFLFSPIVHCHYMAKHQELPKEFDFWKRYDHQFLRACESLYVLQMPHWEESIGVQNEIKYATLHDIPVIYVKCEDYDEDSH